jgi:hypothetical protein
VENEVLHAIADSERYLGAWYGVIFMLLAILMIPDFCSDFWGGGIQSISAD